MAEQKSVVGIRTAQSYAIDPREAAIELHRDILQPETELVLFFCSNVYDLDVLGAEMKRLFAGVKVVGCTTAGEIGPAGYREHSIVGVGFPAGVTRAVTGYIDQLHQFDIARGQAFVKHMLQQLERQPTDISFENRFAFLMIDGLSMCEEVVAHVLQMALGPIPLIGGSAGDGQCFSQTFVYHGDKFYPNSAVLVLITTALPFKVFKTQHFIPGDERLVVTEADPKNRIVKEINGLPAAQAYAKIIHIDADCLSPTCFAASPVVVLIGGTSYVRSIQKVNPDDSLTFFCAIDEGMVFRLAYGQDLESNLVKAFQRLQDAIGPLQLILVCDCILRKLEIIDKKIQEKVEKIMLQSNTVGFNTYGEQFRGIHINQTLTGIAIGTSTARCDE